MRFEIRRETEADFRAVEEVTREAFWNLNSPGCEEHYLAHLLRNHPDFLPELDFVAVHGAEIVGSIMYSASRVEDVPTVTFGPLSVLPLYQGRGVGTALVEHTLALCRQMRLARRSHLWRSRLLRAFWLSAGACVRYLHRGQHVCRRPAGAGIIPRRAGRRAWPLF